MRKKITIILMLALFMLVSAPVSARTFVLSIGIADYDGTSTTCSAAVRTPSNSVTS
mgnify:CR=1 FL=1